MLIATRSCGKQVCLTPQCLQCVSAEQPEYQAGTRVSGGEPEVAESVLMEHLLPIATPAFA